MPNISQLNIAVIGAGAIGLKHLEGFSGHPAARLVAVAETSVERGQAAIEAFKVPTLVSDYREILNREDIDIVSIALPNYLHASVALEALEAGKHVVLDKPMATNADDAEKVAALARSKGLHLMVGQNQRFSLKAQTLKQMCLDGKLGDLYYAKATWLRRSGIPRIGSWFTSKQFAGGGCVYDIGIHVLDLALHFLGEFDVASVSGQTFSKFGPRGLGEGEWGKSETNPDQVFDVEDFASAFIRLKSGRALQLEVSWAAHLETRDVNGVQLFGEDGGATSNPLKLFRSDCGEPVVEEPELADPLVNPDRMQHFVDVVLGEAESFVPLDESLKAQRILDMIYKSAATGEEIRLDV